MKTYDEQLTRLKTILAIPTFFKQEHDLLRYVVKFLRTTPYDFTIDTFGNLYITKGAADWYPLVCAHSDSVQKRTEVEIHEVALNEQIILIGKHQDTDQRCGIGADDKAGVFVCLELLDILPVLKVVLFASEEFGCIGSQNANREFFDDVGYVMEFDCPGSSDITHYCNGIQLFDEYGDFYSQIRPILKKRMPNPVTLHRHPFTDVWPIKQMFDFSCINIATGYYYYHTGREYVVVSEVLNAITIGKEIIETLGNNKYEFKPPLNEITKYNTIVSEFKSHYPEYFTVENDYIKILTETE